MQKRITKLKQAGSEKVAMSEIEK